MVQQALEGLLLLSRKYTALRIEQGPRPGENAGSMVLPDALHLLLLGVPDVLPQPQAQTQPSPASDDSEVPAGGSAAAGPAPTAAGPPAAPRNMLRDRDSPAATQWRAARQLLSFHLQGSGVRGGDPAALGAAEEQQLVKPPWPMFEPLMRK